jgi:hypothetical protein
MPTAPCGVLRMLLIVAAPGVVGALVKLHQAGLL